MYKLEIKLNSPLHITSRTLYGYRNVQDVTYDECGFPYIPASSIKGCLRNACNDLKGFGVNIDANKIFGTYNNKRSSFIIYDAKLKHYRYLKSAVLHARHNKDLPITPNVVVDYYTSLRSIYSNTHCSNICTINKGLTFVALFNIDKQYLEDFKKIVKALKAIGKYKSFGFGEVTCSITEAKINRVKAPKFNNNKDYSRLYIRVTNLSRLALRESYDLFNWTKYYIPGSAILGYLSSRFDKKIDNIKCSNLYIDINGHRSYAAPQCFYNKKIDETILCDKFSNGKRNDDTDQLCKLSDCYLDSLTSNHIRYATAEISDIAHHGINAYYGLRNYNISSIKSFHKFDGFIEADKATLKLIYDELVKNPEINIGSFITRGYGRCRVEITHLETKEKPTKHLCNEFILVLNSQTYLKNSEGLYTTKIENIIGAVSKLLNKELICVENFQSYIKIANYDYLRQCARDHIFCLDKGSIYRFKTKDGKLIDLAPYKNAFIGELNNIGFGELVFLDTNGKYYRKFEEYIPMYEEINIKDNVYGNALIENIMNFAANRLLITADSSYITNNKKFHIARKKFSFSDSSFMNFNKRTIIREIKTVLGNKL